MKSVVCWCFLEKTLTLLSTDTGKNVEPPALYLDPFIPISLLWKLHHQKLSWKMLSCSAEEHTSPPPCGLGSLHLWLRTRQLRSPELLLLQRRVGYWRRKPPKRLLFIFSVPQHLPELQFPSLPASDNYTSLTAEKTLVAISGLEEVW